MIDGWIPLHGRLVKIKLSSENVGVMGLETHVSF